MAIINPRDANFTSLIPIDKIIGTFEDSFNSPAPTSGSGITTTSFSFDTQIPESTFFQGIYSVDSGVTWNDFNSQVDGKMIVSGRSVAGSFVVKADNSYDYSGGGGTTYTVMYKVALIAKLGQGDIVPQPIGSAMLFNSSYNYQKIFSDDSRSLSIANSASALSTFDHPLGYVPKIRSFIETTSTFGGLAAGMYETTYFLREKFSAGASASAGVEASSGICLNESGIYVNLNNLTGSGAFSGTLFMRIYYDD